MSATHQVGLQSLDVVTLVVDDLDEALAFYTETLGFEKRRDETFETEGHEGRWVTVGLPDQDLDVSLVTPDEPYYDAETRDRLEAKRDTGTWWIFRTPDCQASVAALEATGVEIVERPQEYPSGTEAVFADPFGNEFSIFEYAGA